MGGLYQESERIVVRKGLDVSCVGEKSGGENQPRLESGTDVGANA